MLAGLPRQPQARPDVDEPVSACATLAEHSDAGCGGAGCCGAGCGDAGCGNAERGEVGYRVFAGLANQVREARHWLAGLLAGQFPPGRRPAGRRPADRRPAGHPAADDALLALSELATNAVIHSKSGNLGGTFRVRASISEAMIRIEVSDDGGAWQWARQDGDDASGRGLAIVGAIAHDWGITGDTAGRTAWCVIGAGCAGPGCAGPGCAGPGRAAS